MKTTNPEREDSPRLPNDDDTIDKVYRLLSGSRDFDKAMGEAALGRVWTALQEFLDAPDPENHSDFLVQIIASGEKGSLDFRWIAFHWHRIYGENMEGWSIGLPATMSIQTHNGLANGPTNQPLEGPPIIPLDVDSNLEFRDGPNIIIGWDELNAQYLQEQINLNFGE